MALVLRKLARLVVLVTCYLSVKCHQGQTVSWEPQLQEPHLRQMLLSADGQHIIVSGRSHVYVLNSATLELINPSANLSANTKVNMMIYDGPDSDITRSNHTNGYVITCVNTSADYCDVRSVSNVSIITDRFSDFTIIDGVVAFIANTKKPTGDSDKFLFIGCPHVPPTPENSKGRCSQAGITWFSGYDAAKLNTNLFLSYQETRVLTEKYVSGFKIREYRIFFSIQKNRNRAEENVQSRVAQVCQHLSRCDNYEYTTKYTYVDMTIKCGQFTRVQAVNEVTFEGKNIFVAAFSNGSMSAVCVYPLETMKAKFVENIKNCYRGRTQEEAEDYFKPIQGQKKCPQPINITEKPDDYFLCNTDCLQMYRDVIGQNELLAAPNLTFNYNITAVTLVTKYSKVIAFLGSSQGHIIKAVVYPLEHAAKIQQPVYNIERAMIQQDMYTSVDQKHIFFFTQNKIYKQPVEFCSQFDSCGRCLQSKDPYCGWCFLHNRCSTSTDCLSGEWIYPSDCPSIQSIHPSVLSDKSNNTLSIAVSAGLPSHGVSCIFHNENTGLNFTEPAAVTGYKRVECAPRNKHALENNIKGFLNVTVHIVTNISSSPVLSGHFIYYKCETFESCSDCIASNWTCKWCTYSNVCIDRASSCTQNTGMDGSCPMIDGYEILPESNVNLTDKDGIFYFSRDREYEIRARGSHLPEPRPGVKYQCELKGNMSRAAVFQGTYSNDNNKSYVTCDLKMEKLNDILISDGDLRTSLQVSWGKQGDMKMVDGTTQPVSVYKCKGLVQPGNNCGQCKSYAEYQPHYQCVWCQDLCIDSSKECNVTETECGRPEITEVYPLSAHKDAVTRISITGVNLGSTFNDTIGAVTIAGRNCSSVENEYVPGVKIVCDLDPSHHEKNGSVVVKMWNNWGNFDKPFSFRLPNVTSIEPQLGPRSGGTLVTLQGHYLDTGFKKEVKIGNQLCDIDNTHADKKIQKEEITKLLCKTRAWNESTLNTNLDVIVTYDGAPGQKAEHVGYRYLEDPVITKIEPRKSFKSGGRKITIEGIRLYAIQKPKIYAVIRGKKTASEKCTRAQNETASIVCQSPRFVEGLNNFVRNRRSVEDYQVSLGFEMDNVESVSAVQLPPDMKFILYYPDPTLENITGVKNYEDLKGNHLSIKGHNLMLAATEADVLVSIGCDVCNITSMSNETIYCEPPQSEPVCSNIKEGIFIIKVKIGYFERDVGIVKIVDPKNPEERQKEYIIAGTVVGVLGVGLVTTCGVLGVMFKKRKIMKKENQGLAYKMDKLEGTYRTKCREEFAALQTVMADLTSDLEGGNVLFRDYDVYAIKTLFSSQKTDPLLSPPKVLTDQSQMAMDTFKGLLRNRQFLLMLIKTLEKQNSFTIHDKSNVAAILMVLNHDNMEYITSIMMTLLTDLIDKNISANTPKLLLRRSECVSEKLLTHWLSICLYHYLKDQPGSQLFSLYKAIKIFTEKGPIDYITNCGKYTLSEDRLITTDDTEINSVELTLRVTHLDIISNEKKEVSVQLLDCDTITQAKNKMLEVLYKNVPYSHRPAVHSTSLEIETSAAGGVTASELLNDEDASSIKEGLWKKINTLQHYHVQDGAKCQLLFSKEIENASLSLSGASPDSFIIGSFRRSKPVVRTISGSNFWHLTKKHTAEDEVKLSSDLFLPRLIKTKGTLQEYIDNLLLAVLSVGEEPSIIIKYLFDFLDSSASRCGITDPDVLHTWKCNSLLLRFWVNIIKNPEFVFDIHKPQIVDGCLSVIAQTLMDSCSTADLVLGPTSPSNKLLFAKDIPRFKTKVRQYFEDMKKIPAISDQELNSYLTEKVSQKFSGKFHPTSALLEMYSYTARYRNEICREMDNMEASAPGSFSPLTSKLEYIFMTMDAHK